MLAFGLLVRVHGFFCPLGCVRHVFCFQGRDTTGAFSEIAPVVSHFEISFPKLYVYFQRWDTTGAFSEIAPVVSHFEISKLYLYFQRWDTTGAFSKIAPLVSHFEISFSKLYFYFQG